VWSFGADRGVGTVTGQHDRGVGERKEQIVDRRDDRLERSAGKLGGSWPAGEQRVTGEQQRRSFHVKRDRSRRVAGVVDRTKTQTTDFDHLVVIEEDVVAHVGEHRRVECGDRHFETGFSQSRDGLDVIVMAVGLEHAPNPEGRTEFEQFLVLVGGIDEYGITRLSAPHHEHVVVVRTHHQFVHLDGGIVPVESVRRSHETILALGLADAYGEGVSSVKSILASLFVPGISCRQRRTALSIALIITGFVAPIVVPLILLVSSGGFGDLLLDTSSLAILRLVLVIVVLARVVAFAEILVSQPSEANKPVTALAALVAVAVVAIPSVWTYGSIGEITDAVDEIFLSPGSDEPLAAVGPDDADFTTVLLVAGDDGDDRWNVNTDSIVLITTHDPSGRMAMISIDGDVRGLDWSNDSPAGASSIGGANTMISRIFPSVNDDPDLSESYGRGSLAPGAVALAEGLSSSLGIGIDDYVYVNLDGVRDVVDVVGSVSVTAAGELEIPALDGSVSELVGPGRIELSGDQAYRLVSTRTDVSDFDLMIRQRIIISSIGKAVSGTSLLSDLGRLLNVVKNSMRSSLSTSDFLDFLDGLSDRDTSRIDLSLVPDHLDPNAPDWGAASAVVAEVRTALVDGSEFSG